MKTSRNSWDSLDFPWLVDFEGHLGRISKTPGNRERRQDCDKACMWPGCGLWRRDPHWVILRDTAYQEGQESGKDRAGHWEFCTWGIPPESTKCPRRHQTALGICHAREEWTLYALVSLVPPTSYHSPLPHLATSERPQESR